MKKSWSLQCGNGVTSHQCTLAAQKVNRNFTHSCFSRKLFNKSLQCSDPRHTILQHSVLCGIYYQADVTCYINQCRSNNNNNKLILRIIRCHHFFHHQLFASY